MSDMNAALNVAASGLRAQTARMKVIAENIANASSTAPNPGADPYRRKLATFGQVLDRESGATEVKMTGIQKDQSEFRLRYDPTHPGANGDGYVKLPNVNTLIESMDMREAQRAYEANAQTIKTQDQVMSTLVNLR